jgi:hypothetical protein
MKFHRKLLLISFTTLFLIALVWDFSLYLLPSKTTLWNFWFNTIDGSIYLIGGVTAIAYGINFSLKSNIGKMLLFFGIGLLGWGVGNFIWLYYNLNLKVDIPYPSWADAGYSIFYPLMVVGTFFLLKIYQSLVDKKLIIGSVIVSLLSFIVIFGFIAKPDLSAGAPFMQKFFNIYYPAADIVSITLAFIALIIGRGKLHRSLFILSLGLLLQVVGDLSFSYRTAAGIYWNGDIADLSFASAAYFISICLVEIINSLQQAKITAVKQNEI